MNLEYMSDHVNIFKVNEGTVSFNAITKAVGLKKKHLPHIADLEKELIIIDSCLDLCVFEEEGTYYVLHASNDRRKVYLPMSQLAKDGELVEMNDFINHLAQNTKYNYHEFGTGCLLESITDELKKRAGNSDV